MLSFEKELQSKSIAIMKKNNEKNILYLNQDSKKGSNKIICKGNSKLFPYPNFNNREFIYISGPSGSGKSTYAAQYIYNYKKLFPNNDVFIFSRLSDDEVIDMLDVIRVPINESLIEIDVPKDMVNCLVLFDDIDTIPDKSLRNKVYQIQNDILEIGRHNNIYVIVTSHLINGNDRKNCRTILNEANTITFFPRAGSTYGIKYVLKNYLGFNNNQIELILKIPSRWVTIGKNYPQYLFYDKGAFIIN